MTKIQELLKEEIISEIHAIANMQSGSEEKGKAIDDLDKLYRLKIEDEKLDWERETKKSQQSDQAKDRYFKVGTTLVEIAIPLIFYGIWMNRGFKFEETGAYTSTTFRNLFSRFKPTK